MWKTRYPIEWLSRYREVSDQMHQSDGKGVGGISERCIVFHEGDRKRRATCPQEVIAL